MSGAPDAIVTSGHVPALVTTLLGRDDDVRETLDAIGRHRLVTLVGAGGSGKTSLARHVAPDAATASGAAAWWVDLQPVLDGAAVAGAVGEALGVHTPGPVPEVTSRLAGAIAGRRLLLVLDNCEQVVDDLAALVDALLQQCPELVVLATSRTPLALPGEHVVPVEPLGTPEEDVPDPVALRASPATALFLERAPGLDADHLDAAGRAAVTTLCRRLDGLPLAIELAAARARVLTPVELVAALDDRFAVLRTDWRGDVADKQATLEASIAWSYDLLRPAEQRMLRQLAQLPGSFDRATAAHLGCDGDDRLALELLTSLADRSLLLTRPAASGRRHRLLESVRHFGLARLEAEGELASARDAHVAATLSRLQTLGVDGAGAEGLLLRADPWLTGELDDVRRAARHAQLMGRYDDVVDLWWPLQLVLVLLDRTAESATAMAAIPDDAALDPVHADRRAIMLAAGHGRLAATERWSEATALVTELRTRGVDRDRPLTFFLALGVLTTHAAFSGRADPAIARELVALQRDHDADWGPLPRVCNGVWASRSLDVVGHPSDAYELATAGMAAGNALGNDALTALCHMRAGAAALRLGLPLEVVGAHVTAADDLIPPSMHRLRTWFTTTIGAAARLASGDGAGLRALLDELTPAVATAWSLRTVALCYGHLLASLADQDAATALGRADEVIGLLGGTSTDWFALDARAYRAELLRLLGRVDEARTAVAAVRADTGPGTDLLTMMVVTATEGALATLDDPREGLQHLAEAAQWFLDRGHCCWLHLHVVGAAASLVRLGRHRDAAVALGTVAAEHAARGRVVWGVHRDEHAAVLEACRAALPAGDLQAALDAGAEHRWDACIQRLRAVAGPQGEDVGVAGGEVWGGLTRAELDVAERIGAGMSTAEAASVLFVSVNTVKTHLKAVYRKLGCRNRAELAAALADRATD